MDYLSAIDVRTSRRTYKAEAIDAALVNRLEELIGKFNEEAQLHLQFVLNNGQAFEKLSKSYGLLKGVKNYIALVGKNDPNLMEKLGYYGEKLVLEATCMGLGTCWIGGTFDRNACPCQIEQDEKLYGVIVVGNVSEDKTFKERTISRLAHRKTKEMESFYVADTKAPEWFTKGIQAVQKAPSAMNGQPVRVFYEKGVISAKVAEDADYKKVDLGIAKLHFELGVGSGYWELGNGGTYKKD